MQFTAFKSNIKKLLINLYNISSTFARVSEIPLCGTQFIIFNNTFIVKFLYIVINGKDGPKM